MRSEYKFVSFPLVLHMSISSGNGGGDGPCEWASTSIFLTSPLHDEEEEEEEAHFRCSIVFRAGVPQTDREFRSFSCFYPFDVTKVS